MQSIKPIINSAKQQEENTIDDIKYAEDVDLSKLSSFDLIDLKLYKDKQFLSDRPTSNALCYNERLIIGDEKGFINIIDSKSL